MWIFDPITDKNQYFNIHINKFYYEWDPLIIKFNALLFEIFKKIMVIQCKKY